MSFPASHINGILLLKPRWENQWPEVYCCRMPPLWNVVCRLMFYSTLCDLPPFCLLPLSDNKIVSFQAQVIGHLSVYPWSHGHITFPIHPSWLKAIMSLRTCRSTPSPCKTWWYIPLDHVNIEPLPRQWAEPLDGSQESRIMETVNTVVSSR